METPAEHQLDESRLPEGARRVLESYRPHHPDEGIVLVKYMRIVNGRPEVVVDDEADLPPDEELLTMSETVTLNTDDYVQVITEIFVARRSSAGR